jgi:uncharacterized protein (DUF488 family)
MTTLWTIGHGTRPIADFVAILHEHGIGTLVDVRQFPGSRRNPQYSQEPLRAALEQAGLRYVHLVDLGGFRKGGYEAYMATPAWRGGFAALAALVEHGGRVAICCAESVPWKCHRRFIAEHAAQQGWDIVHVIDAKRTLPHRKPRPRQARLPSEGS